MQSSEGTFVRKRSNVAIAAHDIILADCGLRTLSKLD